MKSYKLICSLALFIWLVAASSLHASLTINNTDISGGHYIYDLTWAEQGDMTVFANDVYFSSGNLMMDTVWGVRELCPTNGGFAAQFIFRFDFTGTDYRPTHLNLRDNVALFNNNDFGENTIITTAWSTDNAIYNTIQTHSSAELAPPPSGGVWFGNLDVDLSGSPDMVYYSVTLMNSDGNGFSFVQNQWNRLADADMGGTSYFQADFNVVAVPEPSTTVLILSVAAFLYALLRRRFAAKS